MGSVLCSFSPVLPRGSSTRRSVARALFPREVVEAISLRSASTTTKSSTRLHTCNTSLGRPDHGSDSTGAMTVDWWLARCQSRTADRWTSRPAGLLPIRNFKLACSAEAYTLRQLHLCHRHARQQSSDPPWSVSRRLARQVTTRIHRVSLL